MAAEHPWGVAALNPSIPNVWDANCLHVTDPELGADEIVAIADEVIGGAGMMHRSVDFFDFEAGARIAPEIERHGWEADRTIDMVLEGEPGTSGGAIPVERGRQAEIEPLRRRLIRGDIEEVDAARGEVMVEQLLEWARRLGSAGGDLWFTADEDGEPASSCRLFGLEGIGQVEEVGTIAAAREKGLGGAVTAAAARFSQSRGDDLTFITALADDWPRLMYERMGFRQVSTVWTFRRKA